jgi:hypothetical protein
MAERFDGCKVSALPRATAIAAALVSLLCVGCGTTTENPYGSPILFPSGNDTKAGLDTPIRDTASATDDGGAALDSTSNADGVATTDGVVAADGTGADGTGATDTADGDDGTVTPTDGGANEDGGLGDGTIADGTIADGTVTDGAVTDGAVTDGAVKDDTTLTPDTAATDLGTKTDGNVSGSDSDDNPFDDDVPWGSSEDATPFDAGPINYPDAIVGSTPPNLCAPQVAELNLKEEKVGGKVDVIWWIDTSGSMSQESKYLNQNINSFATFIQAANIDFRMILVGNGFGICVQPPLGGAGCSNGPQFMHVKQTIGSKNGNQILVSSYPQWKNFLRADATKNFVAVTDDDSTQSAAWFEQQMVAADPVQFKISPDVPFGFVYHSIVAYESKADCPTIAKKGEVYLQLTAKTGGAKFKVCDTNWAPMFAALAKSVVQTAKPGCEYKIPFPNNVVPNPAIGLSYVAKDDLFAVPKAENNLCPFNGVGFTIDDPVTPSKITLCNASCDLLKGGGNLQFDFGCF